MINGLDSSTFILMSEEARENVRQITATGREMGRDPNRLSILGDSLIATPQSLAQWDEGTHNLGEYELAIEDYLRALELSARSFYAKNHLCWDYSLIGQPDVGLEYCNSLLSGYISPDVYDSRGLAHGLLDDYEAEQVGSMRMIYMFILLSHIFFAVLVVPFVLFAFYFALTDRIEKHRKTVRFTLPLWLYVSVTGVLVYLMIRPYY